MKHIFTYFIFLAALTSATAQTLKGTLKDARTGEPLPYVNIGVVKKGIGTVSDENGKFNLPVPEGHSADTIRISMIGYAALDYTVAGLAKRLHGNSGITMNEQATQLKEIVVTNRKQKEKLLGNKTQSQGVTAAFTTNKLGNEVGMIMRIKGSPTLLKTFNASIASDKNPPVKMRLNFYNVKKGLPNELIIKENIIIEAPRSSGLLTVDLSPYNIMVDDDFFVTLEWIEDAPGRVSFSAALLATPIISRGTSQDEWTKTTIAGIGFTVDTTYWK